MTIKSFINQMKEPIYKDDLKRVLLNGIVNALLYGMLGGALQYFTETVINLSFSIFILLIAFMTAKKVSDSFFNFHIAYPLITMGCFVLGYMVYGFAKYQFMFRDFMFALRFYFSSIGMQGLWGFIIFFKGNILYNLFDLLIFIIGLVTCWQIVCRRR